MEIKNRNSRKERIGIVTSNSMDKSAVVSVERRVKHRIYGKFIKKHLNFLYTTRTMNVMLVIKYQ